MRAHISNSASVNTRNHIVPADSASSHHSQTTPAFKENQYCGEGESPEKFLRKCKIIIIKKINK